MRAHVREGAEAASRRGESSMEESTVPRGHTIHLLGISLELRSSVLLELLLVLIQKREIASDNRLRFANCLACKALKLRPDALRLLVLTLRDFLRSSGRCLSGTHE